MTIFSNRIFSVPSGSLAEDPDVYVKQIRRSDYPDKYLERGEPQGPLRETPRGHEQSQTIQGESAYRGLLRTSQ
ncbi:hypothetical protein SAMN05192574_10558 [Mucilaginibacter gossypiicola]|uniref:Uncharacterized protein n=1 Tax=Mucilaginibacter gossypiicola TaxID=551995 RepID=A0A1H8LEA8_9SPHI|nr:hypothetical protein SAMN05192574_10558 [Mucilaginibacter gossypiicola]